MIKPKPEPKQGSIDPPKNAADAPAAQQSALRRWAPLAAIAALMASAYAFGLHEYLSFKTIGLNYEALRAFIADNIVVAVLAYIALYIAVVALSLPGGLVMTLSGGLLFGWLVGAAATVVGATIGATIIFLVAKTSFGEGIAAKAGPWIGRLRAGFQENALSYLLFLRLVPLFPFFVVNLAPALLGVPLSTYVLGTVIGIIPGTTAFSVLGAGLGSAVEAQNAIYNACIAGKVGAAADACTYTIDTKALVTPELLAAFALLGVVALIPVALKKWSSRNANA
ncbi:MAG: TVP38/TMEM64 family protein [Hyphomicrobiaceae bacterium]|nr:TVP38/TMEM64 family protein [Hyphomicrobiaceae bacterium]